MRDKRGSLPAVVEAELLESRFFTVGAIFFKNRQCNKFLLHCCNCVVRRCLVTNAKQCKNKVLVIR
jgi:hypothetical protein